MCKKKLINNRKIKKTLMLMKSFHLSSALDETTSQITANLSKFNNFAMVCSLATAPYL